MIETTYGEARNAYQALSAIMEMDIRIPIKASLRWKRIMGLLRPFVDQFGELEQEIQLRYVEKDEDGRPIEVSPGQVRIAQEHIEAYVADIREAAEEKIKVGSDQVLAADFGEGEVPAKLVRLLLLLGPFLED